MKKFVVVFFLAVSFFSVSLQAENIKLSDTNCYTISFATIAFNSIQMMGSQLRLEEDKIIFSESSGRVIGQLNKVGYILAEAPLEKCKKKDKPDLSQLLKN